MQHMRHMLHTPDGPDGLDKRDGIDTPDSLVEGFTSTPRLGEPVNTAAARNRLHSRCIAFSRDAVGPGGRAQHQANIKQSTGGAPAHRAPVAPCRR